MTKVMTVSELAAYLHISRGKAYKMVSNGPLNNLLAGVAHLCQTSAADLGPYREKVSRPAIVFLLAMVFGFAAPSGGYAATLTVCASKCKYTTIAAAIAAAKPGSTISILDAVHTEWNITVDRNLTIRGQGAAKTAVDGAANGTVFTVESGVTATFHNLTIQNGNGGVVGGEHSGGGISNHGTLTVKNAALTGNLSFSGDVAGVTNNGTLTVIKSTFSDNSAFGGGAIVSGGTLTITDSTFSGNSAFGPSWNYFRGDAGHHQQHFLPEYEFPSWSD
jgi:predicted outer membrane repeat protein